MVDYDLGLGLDCDVAFCGYKKKGTFLVDGQVDDWPVDVQLPQTLCVDEISHDAADEHEVDLVLVADQEVFRCHSFQEDDGGAGLFRLEGDGLDGDLGTAALHG